MQLTKKDYQQSSNVVLSSSLECRLPLWNFALVVMGVLASLFALVGTIETIIDGIFTCYYLPEEVRKGELCH